MKRTIMTVTILAALGLILGCDTNPNAPIPTGESTQILGAPLKLVDMIAAEENKYAGDMMFGLLLGLGLNPDVQVQSFNAWDDGRYIYVSDGIRTARIDTAQWDDTIRGKWRNCWQECCPRECGSPTCDPCNNSNGRAYCRAICLLRIFIPDSV